MRHLGPLRKTEVTPLPKQALTVAGISTLLLFLVACSEDMQSPVDRYNALLNNGTMYLEQGQFNAAYIEATNAINLDSTNLGAHLLIARIHLQLGRYRAALGQLQVANPGLFVLRDQPGYEFTLVEAYLSRSKFKSAQRRLAQVKTALQAVDPLRLARLELQAHAGLEEFDKALSMADEILANAPGDPETLLYLARISLGKGDALTAERHADSVLKTDPDNVEVMLFKAQLLYMQGRLAAAEETLSLAAASLPTTDIYTGQRARVLSSLSSVLARQGRTGEALTYQQQLSEAFPSGAEVQERYALAMTEIGKGNLEQAESILEQLEQTTPGNETTGTLLGVIKHMQGDPREAESLFDENVDGEIASPLVVGVAAVNQFQLNQPYKLLELLSDRIDEVTNPRLLALYGVAALSANRGEEGVNVLRRALQLDPQNARPAIAIANYLNTQQPPDLDMALAELREAEKHQPADISLQSNLLRQLLLLELHEEARDYAKSLVDRYPQVAASHLIAGTLHVRFNEFEQAHAKYLDALKVDRETLPAWYGIARINIEQKNWIAAEEAYQQIIDIDGDQLEAYRGLYTIYRAQGNGEAGIARLEQLITKVDASAAAVAVSEIHFANNNQAAGEQYLSLARQRDPESQHARTLSANVHYQRGIQMMRGGDFTNARTAIFTALTSFPGNRQMLALLVETEIRSGELREAAKVLREMERLHPSAILVDALRADLYVAEGEPESALPHYLIAWTKLPSDVIASKYFRTFRHLGRLEEGEQFLATWRSVFPSSVLATIMTGDHFIATKRPEKAIELYENLLVHVPDSTAALNNLALLYLEARGPESALPLAERAYSLASVSPSIGDTYGWILYKLGEPERALPILREAAQIDANLSELQAHLAEVKAAIGNTKSP